MGHLGNDDAHPPSVALPSKAEGPAREVYHVKGDPAEAFGCLGTVMGRRQERTLAAGAKVRPSVAWMRLASLWVKLLVHAPRRRQSAKQGEGA